MYAIMAVRQYYVREISELRLTFWDINLIIKISFNCQFATYIIISRSKSFLKRAILVTWICFTIHGYLYASIISYVYNHHHRKSYSQRGERSFSPLRRCGGRALVCDGS